MLRHVGLGLSAGLAVAMLAGPAFAQSQTPQAKEVLPWAQPAATANTQAAAKPDKPAAKKSANASVATTAPAKPKSPAASQGPVTPDNQAAAAQPQASAGADGEPGPLQKWWRNMFPGSAGAAESAPGQAAPANDMSWVPQPNG